MQVIVVEDQALLREGLARLFIDASHEVVGRASSAEQLEELVASGRPDLVVLDIRMPPTFTDEGAVAARRLKSGAHPPGVLLLSQHIETNHIVDLVSHPGFGYLLKDRVLEVAEFVSAAERVAAGGSALDPQVVSALVAQRGPGPLDRLSERERDVLALMAEGLNNAGIAERLVLSPRTVEAHVGHVLAKLDVPESDDAHRRVLAVLEYLRAAP